MKGLQVWKEAQSQIQITAVRSPQCLGRGKAWLMDVSPMASAMHYIAVVFKQQKITLAVLGVRNGKLRCGQGRTLSIQRLEGRSFPYLF
jgi:hypothetical protein